MPKRLDDDPGCDDKEERYAVVCAPESNRIYSGSCPRQKARRSLMRWSQRHRRFAESTWRGLRTRILGACHPSEVEQGELFAEIYRGLTREEMEIMALLGISFEETWIRPY